jgi:hypothetical protein
MKRIAAVAALVLACAAEASASAPADFQAHEVAIWAKRPMTSWHSPQTWRRDVIFELTVRYRGSPMRRVGPPWCINRYVAPRITVVVAACAFDPPLRVRINAVSLDGRPRRVVVRYRAIPR